MMDKKLLCGAVLAAVLSACSTKVTDDSGRTTGDQSGSAAQGGMTGGKMGMPGAGASAPLTPAVEQALEKELSIKVGDRVFFATDRYSLTEEGHKTLERQAAWLHAYPLLKVMINGHCDERGTREYNLALGERRANSVKEYLVGLGINPARIMVKSWGKEKVLVLGSTPEAWAQNRVSITTVDQE